MRQPESQALQGKMMCTRNPTCMPDVHAAVCRGLVPGGHLSISHQGECSPVYELSSSTSIRNVCHCVRKAQKLQSNNLLATQHTQLADQLCLG